MLTNFLNRILAKREIKKIYLVNPSEVIEGIKKAQSCPGCAARETSLSEMREQLTEARIREDRWRDDYKELQDLLHTRFGLKPWTPAPATAQEGESQILRERRIQGGLTRMASKQATINKEAWQKQVDKVAEFDRKNGIVNTGTTSESSEETPHES